MRKGNGLRFVLQVLGRGDLSLGGEHGKGIISLAWWHGSTGILMAAISRL